MHEDGGTPTGAPRPGAPLASPGTRRCDRKDEMRATRSARPTRRRAVWLPALVLAGVVIAVWAFAAQVLGPTLLPTPTRVLEALGELASTGDLWPATAWTVGVAARGVALAVLIALPLAWIIVHVRAAAAALEPYIAISQAIPAIAIAPLLALWFGYGAQTTALLATLITFFPLVIATSLGLRDIDREVIAAARVDGAGTGQVLRHIEVPLALPHTLAGLRAAVALAMTGAVVGEFVIGGRGLGQLLVAQRDRVDTAGMFATLLILAGVSTTGYLLVRWLEHRARILTGI